MDPYLEGYIWSDVHGGLARAIQELLAHQIAPKYVARVEQYTVKDKFPGSEAAILYPDIGLVLHDRAEEPVAEYEPATKATIEIIIKKIPNVCCQKLDGFILAINFINKNWQLL